MIPIVFTSIQTYAFFPKVLRTIQLSQAFSNKIKERIQMQMWPLLFLLYMHTFIVNAFACNVTIVL